MYVGIDVGGTNLKAGLVDAQGRLLATVRLPLGVFQGAEGFARTLADLSRQVAVNGGVDPMEIECVGIGIPGAVAKGEILYTCNIPMKDIPLGKLFRRHLNVPVLLENDANCAAVGEWHCGAGRGTKDFVVITLGTGVGGGFILNGKLYTGSGMVGEVGHMVIEHNGAYCNCGRRGCWESYASATGLIRMTKETMAAHPETLLHSLAAEIGVEGRTAFLAAQQGDDVALALCQQYVDYLAAGITNLVNILQPEVIAVGGGVAGAPEALLLSPLREIVLRDCYPCHAGGVVPQVVQAELGNAAGIIGAALLGRTS